MSAPRWEQCKENTAPLERGRNVKRLEKGLKLQEQVKGGDEKNKVLRHYERLVKPSEQTKMIQCDGDEPLVNWLGYIKFFQDAFPADTHEQFLLMERCTRALIKMRQFANDDRFIGICAKYADRTKDPSSIFKYLYQQKIGQETAVFFIAWAYVAEKRDDFKFAEQIFQKGIGKKAQPIAVLQTRYMQFQRRMSRYWLNASRQNDALEDEEESQHGGANRRTLGGLSHDRAKRNERVRTSARLGPMANPLRSEPAQSSSNSCGENIPPTSSVFPIFVEQANETGFLDDSNPINPAPRILETDADRKKENTLEAERWNERGGLASAPWKTAPEPTSTAIPSSGPLAPFAVFVDEECAAQNEQVERRKQIHDSQQRQVRDERTFRERRDVGVAEKLAQDPLRYMRNPSKFDSDTAKTSSSIARTDQEQSEQTKTSQTKTERSKTGFNMKLMKGDDGTEQCFEEARMKARCYTLVQHPVQLNLLRQERIQVGMIGQADTSSFMEIDSTVESICESPEQKPREMQQPSARPPTYRSKSPLRSSSTHGTLGEVRFHPELVMNTSLNQSHISTASSAVDEAHAVGLPMGKEEETINTKFAMKELSMMFSSPAGLGLDGAQRHTARKSRLDQSSQHGTNAVDTSYNISDMIGQMHLDNSILVGSDLGDEARAGEGGKNALPEKSEKPPLGFAIFEDEGSIADASEDNASVEPKAGFVIFSEESQGATNSDETSIDNLGYEDKEETLAKSTKRMSSHTIDTSTTRRLKPLNGMKPEETVMAGFQIFADDTEQAECWHENSKQEISGIDGEDDDGDDGETATLSLFGDIMDTLDRNAAPRNKPSNKLQIFEDNLDTNNKLVETQSKQKTVGTCDDKPIENTTTIPSSAVQSAVQISDTKLVPVPYGELHQTCVRLGLRKLRSAVSNASGTRLSLGALLSQEGASYSLPHVLVPRAFRGTLESGKTEVCIGNHTGTVAKELGRGTYGVVTLMDVGNAKAKDDAIAVKSQLPTDSLAWECEVLRRISKRLDNNNDNYHPFPKPLAFLHLADGALLGMTASSKSGLTLLGLANLYKSKLAERVPECVVLFYTSRMLKIVQQLHAHAHILHCDIKPDNFVLCSTDDDTSLCSDMIGGDLTLVDFGCAIDLVDIAPKNMMDAQLTGNPTVKSMSCVAMQNGMPWSFDLDTYGILCCAHVLIFGKYMEVEKGHGDLWQPHKKFERYWQRELWQELFSTLLNNDSTTGTAMGSRAPSLKVLREKIDRHLQGKSGDLRSAIRRQSALLLH